MNHSTPSMTFNGRLLLTGTLAAIVIGLMLPLPGSYAQQGYRRLPPPKKKTALDSLSALHKKVKHNLFGRGDRDSADYDRYDSDRSDDRYRQDYDREYDRGRDYERDLVTGRPYRDSAMPPQRAAHVQFEQSVDRYQDHERGREYDDHYDRGSRSDHHRRESDRALRSTGRDTYRAPQRRQANDSYHDQYEEIEPLSRERAQPRRGDHYGSRSTPDHGQAAPPTHYDDAQYQKPYDQRHQTPVSSAPHHSPRDMIHDSAHGSPQNSPQNHLRSDSHGDVAPENPQGTDYRTGHYRNGTAVTVQQFNQQETATQRVLKLQEENQKLIDTRNTMTSQNKRLLKMVQEKDQLLTQIEKAIDDARNELKSANQDNEKLKLRVAQLESEKADQMLASSRQMDAIRKQLDDVLMREITSK